MPQARRSASGSSSGAGGAKRSGQSRRPGTSTRAKSTTSASRSKASAGAKSADAQSAGAKAASSATDGLDAIAQRVRKLNERIIESGKEAGEATLTNYEKALKAIARGLESGPGRSDIEWIAHLATTQARFIRDVTEAWTSAARGMLK
jgi:hypothetical protein